LELTLSVNSKQPVFHFNPFKNRAFANPRFQHRFLPASRHHVSILLVVFGGCWWFFQQAVDNHIPAMVQGETIPFGGTAMGDVF
jgi:hypothetical protein